MFKPIKSVKISDRVYEQLRDMIYRGELRAGEKLMSERGMAIAFNVGRPTVREAIQKLTEQGLIESRRGVGTFVLGEDTRKNKKPLLQLLNGQDFTIVDLLEVRLVLESNSAALAARRATEQDIRIIEQSLNRLLDTRYSADRDLDDELSFHMNIAYATKNIVQVHLMKSFYDVLYYGMNLAFPTLIKDEKLDEMTFDQHITIFKAIENRDPELAAETMESHIRILLEMCIQKEL
ncbi:MAG: FadR/GntR family transcriptional regulator [Desulfobacteraceae bacterium]|jgi:GntR family transcriptional repressor for pyruvate dehydrogenase complex